MASLTDGRDGRYTMADLATDLSDLIAMGLVAVTGEYLDLRYVITPDGERALAEYEASVRTEARDLAERRNAANQPGIVINLPNGA